MGPKVGQGGAGKSCAGTSAARLPVPGCLSPAACPFLFTG